MRSVKGLLISFIVFAVCALGWGVRVYALENAQLAVAVRSYDGEEVAVRPGSTFYTCLPVTFTPSEEGSLYSISTDDGADFGRYIPMDSKSVTLFPDDKTSSTGRWQIRFKNRGRLQSPGRAFPGQPEY